MNYKIKPSTHFFFRVHTATNYFQIAAPNGALGLRHVYVNLRIPDWLIQDVSVVYYLASCDKKYVNFTATENNGNGTKTYTTYVSLNFPCIESVAMSVSMCVN